MKYVLSILGIIGSFYMVYYREKIGDMLGETEMMQKVGGVYNVVVLVALFIFIWSIAELTNTTDILFMPLTYLIPGARPESTDFQDF